MLITLIFWIYKTLKNVSFVLLMFNFYPFFGQEMPHKNILVIDPGHGGVESGAVGVNGIKEKDVVLEVAEEIIRLNKTLFDGQLDIYLTRYRDTLISLSDRTKLAKAINADVFISLHCNHSDNPNAKGVEVYVHNSENSFSRESIWLGFVLQKGLNEKLGFKSRGVKFANFQVLREISDRMPSVLVELGFLSNDNEGNHHLKVTSIRAMAMVLLEGLIMKAIN